AKNGAATNASTTMRARMVSPLARRAEGGALRPQRVCLSIGEPGGRTTRTTPLLLGTLKVAPRGGGKLCGSSRCSVISIAAATYKQIHGVASGQHGEHATSGTVAA